MTEEINYGLADSLMKIFGYERVGKMTATIWTGEDCERCEQAKNILKNKGYEITEIEANKLITGVIRDIDTMAQLASQNMSLPVIMIDDLYIDVDDFLKNERR